MVDDLLGVAEEALGKEGSGTFEMLGDFDGVAECLEEFDGFDTDGRIVEVGEFVAEEENFAFLSGVFVGAVFSEPCFEGGFVEEGDAALGGEAGSFFCEAGKEGVCEYEVPCPGGERGESADF